MRQKTVWFELPASIFVKCTDSFDTFKCLVEGRTYEVTHVSNHGEFVVIDTINGNVLPGWQAYRFEQVKQS